MIPRDHLFSICQDRIKYSIATQEVLLLTGTSRSERCPKADAVSAPITAQSLPLASLSLIITRMCNLCCPYCYARGLYDASMKGAMDEGTGRAAINLFLRASPNPNCQVVLIGGEAMLAWDLITRLVDYGEEQASLLGRRIFWRLSTNGTLFPPGSLQFLRDHHFELLIDIDGPPEVHDRNRPYHDGRGSAAVVLSNYKRLREAGVSPISLRATVTPLFPQVPDIYATLRDLRPEELRIIPQFFEFGSSGWGEDALSMLLAGYTELAEEMLSDIIHETYRGIRLDPFTAFIHLLCARRENRFYCGGAGGMIAVTPEGKLYPCPALVRDDACLGSIRDGIDCSRLKAWRDSCDLEKRPTCSTCWARYLCGGGCYAHAAEVTGTLDRPVEIECRIMKHVVELAIWLYARILEEKPELFLNLVSGSRELFAVE
jgi:uncharacterized protein